MTLSTRTAEAIKVVVEPHPNADTLSIVKIGGWQVVVKTDEWRSGDVGIYVKPDTMIPQSIAGLFEIEFLFADETKLFVENADKEHIKVAAYSWPDLAEKMRYSRITMRRFRGEESHGILLGPFRPTETLGLGGAAFVMTDHVGRDFFNELGLQRYEQFIARNASCPEANQASSRPCCDAPDYDVDNIRSHMDAYREGQDPVYYTEKIHGENARFGFLPNKEGSLEVFVGSHHTWKKAHNDNQWWQALRDTPGLLTTIMENPGLIFYGELYGHVSGFGYDAVPGHKKIRIFDAYDSFTHRFIPYSYLTRFLRKHGILMAPILNFEGTPEHYSYDRLEQILEELKNTTTLNANHVCEGIVIHHAYDGGRTFKFVSNAYLEGKKGKKK